MCVRKNVVSIHALLAECDFRHQGHGAENHGFNPRTPCGVRQAYSKVAQPVVDVSIHALLAECDLGCVLLPHGNSGFNPRTPCGVRRYIEYKQLQMLRFQSTHSLRSATIIAFPISPPP